MRDYDEKERFTSSTIKRRFKGWNAAIEKAGLTVSYQPNIPEKELFESMVKLGRQPKRREMIPPLSKHSESPYVKRFGSWRKGLEAFVEYMNKDVEEVPIIEEIKELISKNETIFKHKTKRDASSRLKVQVLMRDGNKCRLCGVTVTGDNIHFDHVKPWSKGGETTLENLQVLCAEHNLAKGNLE